MTPDPTPTAVLRDARRAWFRAGVRRRDRRALSDELGAELAAAIAVAPDGTTSPGGVRDVLGDDPGPAALEWARARGVTDRRLRLLPLVVPVLLGGVVASGAVLALLADAFHGDSVLADPRPAEILSVYAASGLLSYAAMALVAGTVLRRLGDRSAARTVRMLLAALPVGAAAAIVSAVLVAGAYGYRPDARTATLVGLDVLVVLAVTVVAARWVAVRRHTLREHAVPAGA